ncbi:sulfur carrier protein ThiS [Verrucomicrobiales bacterium]|nr:sulfur carrier protein ThiS [Verrucomicrobiales bacterium]
MNLIINGAPKETESSTIESLLADLDMAGVPVLVEHQGTALFPRDFAKTAITEGDTIEIIRVVAGG